MANETRQIRIESILGGQSPSTHFGAADQYQGAFGIDPSFRASNSRMSGLIRPVGVVNTTSSVSGSPVWMIPNPKDFNVYVLTDRGSTHTYNIDTGSFTDLSDGGSMTGSSGNGAAYYDNYMYFAKDTTVARYGPLNGTPAFDGQYWDTTLSKTALNDGSTTYPRGYGTPGGFGFPLPDHILHRHSDGRLYIADVVGNQGTIHFIQTTKTTVEGDTDNGSTYDALNLGYGLYPTAIESYGEFVVIALFEGGISNAIGNTHTGRAKLAFWDTTSRDVNQITWEEFPDEVITSLKNVNGTLFIVSTQFAVPGANFRLSRYVGGNSFEEVFYHDNAYAPYPGAVYGVGERLMFGSYTFSPGQGGCVFSYGLRNKNLGTGLFGISRISSQNTSFGVTALCPGIDTDSFIIGTANLFNGGQSTDSRIDITNTNPGDTNNPIWLSQIYRIGQPFKIKKIRIPLAQAMTANMVVTPTLYFDEGVTSQQLTTINSTNYPNGETNVVQRPNNATGNHNFYLGLEWSGSALCVIGLPITIEYELIDD